MALNDHVDLPTFMQGVSKRNAGQTEFIQAVQEVAVDIFDFMEGKAEWHHKVPTTEQYEAALEQLGKQ